MNLRALPYGLHLRPRRPLYDTSVPHDAFTGGNSERARYLRLIMYSQARTVADFWDHPAGRLTGAGVERRVCDSQADATARQSSRPIATLY